MTVLTIEATDWTRNGYSVIPITKRGKRPLVKWTNYVESPPTIRQVVQWFKNDINMAVLCGGANNLTVIDFDTQLGYYTALARIDTELREKILGTLKVKTARGIHVFVRVSTRSRKNVKRKIDIKGIGGYVLVPPSIHPSGVSYTRLNGARISDIITISTNDLQSFADLDDEEAVVAQGTSPRHFNDIDLLDDGFLRGNDDILFIQKTVPILSVAMIFTPMFRRHGNSAYWMGICPHPQHNDKSPSFWVNTSTGMAGCFGTGCPLNDKAVDIIGLYKELKNIGYREAIHALMNW